MTLEQGAEVIRLLGLVYLVGRYLLIVAGLGLGVAFFLGTRGGGR
jgi:hypothetical protein